MGELRQRILFYGYGNPGRGDDGLGPALAEAVEQLDLSGVTVDCDYQLTVEDAAALAEHDVVLFADAAATGPEPFWFGRVLPTPHHGISSHSVSPGALVALCESLFSKQLQAYVIGVRGYDFGELTESLSSRARANYGAALSFLRQALEERRFPEYVERYGFELDRASGEERA
jgi:hydrogenase maturation protease